MRGLVVILMVLLSTPMLADASLQSYEAAVSLDGEAEWTIVIRMQAGTTSVALPTIPSSFVYVEGAAHTIVGNMVELTAAQDSAVRISFAASSPTETTSKGKLFSVTFVSPADIQDFSLSLKLPEGAALAFENNAPIISPTAKLSTDGAFIVVTWSGPIKADQPFTAVAVYRKEEGVFVPLAIVTAALLGGVVYLLRKQRVSKSVTHLRHRAPVSVHAAVRAALSSDERAVLTIVDKYGSKTMQSDVTRELGFSKAKVSKLVSSLAAKNVIEKKPYGKTNVLKLKAAP